jgi:hypothetical protein
MMETRQKRGLAAVGRFLVGGDMARQSRKEYAATCQRQARHHNFEPGPLECPAGA